MSGHSEERLADFSPVGEADDLEAAYRAALDALDEAEFEVGRAFGELNGEEPPAEPEPDAGEPETVAVAMTSDPTSGEVEPAPRAVRRPERILEAALFVGGTPLTTRRLVQLFNEEFDASDVERFVAELNARYQADGRPYEITFGEGGYRFALRSEFEETRQRLFGLGPREVRLSQEALEVLSLVAYRQPIERDEVEERGGRSAAATLRQLLRRELVAMERDAENPKQVRYRTTERFLEVFGIADLAELPRAGELEFK